jgi:hypothetical protein
VALLLALLVTCGPMATAMPQPVPPDAASTPATTADERLGALALSLGFDLERIFRFVADEIRYEPYAGILRGAEGALDAGAGNSLDQALLLRALLDASGITHRFARGSLDEAAAARLAEAALMDVAEATEATEVAMGGGPVPAHVDVSQRVAADPADPAELASIEAAAQAALQMSETHVADSVALVTTALGEAGITLEDGAPMSLDSLLPPGETTAHTWVQVAQGPDWLDLDPTLGPAAVPGDALAEAEVTLTSLPDELRHVVRFEVLLERVRGDGLETIPIIQYEGFADELSGESITLAHIQPSAVHQLGVTVSRLSGEARLTYYPILTVPEGTVVSTDGVSFGVQGGELDVFDTSTPVPSAIADGEASGEWLAVTIESPDAEPVTARRPVFDRVPVETRFGAQPSAADVQPIELVPWADSGGLDFAPLLGTDAFAISTGSANQPDMLALAIAPSMDMIRVLAGSYLGLRDGVAAHSIVDHGAAPFIDRPGVVSYSIDVDSEGGELTLASGVDLWHRSLGALPTRGSTSSRARHNLVAGVVEHVAERLAIEAFMEDADRGARSVSVSTVFGMAADAGVPILVLRRDVPSTVSFAPQTRALIEEALRAGDTVIVPAEPVHLGGRDRLGWWRVDPVTGVTSDMMDDGTGSAMTEMTPLLRTLVCAAVFMPAYTQILSALFDGVANKVLGVVSGAATAYWIWNFKNLPILVGACMKGGFIG